MIPPTAAAPLPFCAVPIEMEIHTGRNSNSSNTKRNHSNFSTNNANPLASPHSYASFTAPPPPVKDEKKNDNEEGGKSRKVQKWRRLARRFWKVAAPYWFSKGDKLRARLHLAAVFALTLLTTAMSVGFNFLSRDFYNALADKNRAQFTKLLLYYLGAFAAAVLLYVIRDYAQATLALRWRSWMTKYYLERYFKHRAFYRIQSQSLFDNPDQRIVDDLNSFTSTSLSFCLIVFNSAVDLIAFGNILFRIYPPLFAVLFAYAIGGTAISVFLGKSLVNLNFLQEKKEADFRYGLVRARENAESIAFYGGEQNELQLLLQRFKSAFENMMRLLIVTRNLEFFTSGYAYLIQILPAAVVAPLYFSGKITFGVINQSTSAFNNILSDVSLIVFEFEAITAFSAVINRLGEFDDVLDYSTSKRLSEFSQKISLVYCNVKRSPAPISKGSMLMDQCRQLLNIENLTLLTPTDKVTLIRGLSLTLNEKDHLLVTGPSGSGKTSLLRALAGLWSEGRGNITYYVADGEDPLLFRSSEVIDVNINVARDTDVSLEGSPETNVQGMFFLPQKPYMVLGTLRQQLLYPTWADYDGEPTGSLPFFTTKRNSTKSSKRVIKPTTDDLIQILETVRLSYLLPRFGSLDSTHEWASVLSLGEQQRLAFARLLLSKPKLALLDESTSALDEANEAHLYQQIEASGITYVSIGHRGTLYKHHTRVLRISTVDRNSEELNWHVEFINHDASFNFAEHAQC